MILVDGVLIEDKPGADLVDEVTRRPSLVEAAERFGSAAPSPASSAAGCVPENKKHIYVLQGETASVEYQADDAVLASDDATTCVIAAVVCRTTGMAAMAHFDEITSKSDLCLRKFLGCMYGGRHCVYDLYLVGGMIEDSGVGLRTASNILSFIHRSNGVFHLRLACVQRLNTLPSGAPRSRSFALDASRDTAAYSLDGCAAHTKTNRGPGLDQRLAHFWLVSSYVTDLVSTYDPHDQEFVLHGFTHTVPRWLMVNAAYLLTLSDEDLLLKTSTTPRHEGPNFVDDVRRAMQFIVARAEKPFTLFSRSFSWEPSLRQWMEMDAAGKTGKLTQQEFRKPLSRSVSYQALDELDIDIPGSSWSEHKVGEASH